MNCLLANKEQGFVCGAEDAAGEKEERRGRERRKSKNVAFLKLISFTNCHLGFLQDFCIRQGQINRALP